MPELWKTRIRKAVMEALVKKRYCYWTWGLTNSALVSLNLSKAMVPFIVDTRLIADFNRIEFGAISLPFCLSSRKLRCWGGRGRAWRWRCHTHARNKLLYASDEDIKDANDDKFQYIGREGATCDRQRWREGSILTTHEESWRRSDDYLSVNRGEWQAPENQWSMSNKKGTMYYCTSKTCTIDSDGRYLKFDKVWKLFGRFSKCIACILSEHLYHIAMAVLAGELCRFLPPPDYGKRQNRAAYS